MTLTHGILTLGRDRPAFTAFDNRPEFLEQCRYLIERNIEHMTFERKMRKGRWLWHPIETRFFDARYEHTAMQKV